MSAGSRFNENLLKESADTSEIAVDVEYAGLVAKLAGQSRDRYTLPEGGNLETLLSLVFSRHESLAKGKGALLIAVNNKVLTVSPELWGKQRLHNGDHVMLTVKIIGG